MRVALVGMDSFFFTQTISGLLGDLPGVEWVGCCDLGVPDECAVNAGKTPQEIADAHGVPLFSDLDSLLASAKPDAAIIATNPARIPDVAAELAGAGLHLYIVKPAALNAAGAETLRASIVGSEQVIVSGMTYRRHPSVIAAREALASGAIGELSSFRAMHQHGRLSIWEPKSWYFTESDVHPAIYLGWYVTDMFRWFVGEAATDVAALGSGLADPTSPHEDTVRSLCKAPSGVVGSLDVYFGVSWPYADLEFELLGTSGAIRFNARDGGEIVTSDGAERIEPASVNMMQVELEAWIAAASGGIDDWHRPEEWLDALDHGIAMAEALKA
jgi:predicted dehydrogenase